MHTSRVLVKRHQRSIQYGFNSKSAICQVRSTLLTHIIKYAPDMTCVGQLDNSQCISAGAAVMLEGVYFKAWTSEYELQQVPAYCELISGQCSPWAGDRKCRQSRTRRHHSLTHSRRASPNNLAWMLSDCAKKLEKTQRQRESRQTCVPLWGYMHIC